MGAFSDLLRRRREAADLTQDELGNRLGVSSSTISRWERDIDHPRDENMPALSQFLGMPTTDLDVLLTGRTRARTREHLGIEERIERLESRTDELVTVLGRLFDRVAFDGQRVALRVGGREIEIDGAAGTIHVYDGHGNEILCDSSGVRIDSARNVRIEASTIEGKAATTSLHGVVKCDTLIAKSVVAASYSAGAGNIW